MKKGSFKTDIYGFTTDVVIVPNVTETTKYYLKLIKKYKQPSEGEGPCEGFIFIYGFKTWVVLSEQHLTIDTITHEVSHLTFKMLNVNAIFNGSDNETYALLNGFLNRQVFNLIEKLGCKIIMTTK